MYAICSVCIAFPSHIECKNAGVTSCKGGIHLQCTHTRLREIQGPLSSLIAARGEGAPCKSTDPPLAGCTRMTHIFHRYTPGAQWACYRVLLCTYTHPVCTCHEPLTQRKIKQRRHATRVSERARVALFCCLRPSGGRGRTARDPTGSPACK